MRKIWVKYKWPLLVLVNALPFLLNVIFFANGGMDDLFLFLPIFAGLTVLNFQNCNKVGQFIVFQAFILVCLIGSGYASTYLYYHNISDDFMTPIVGGLLVLLEAATGIIVTTITTIVKGVKNQKAREEH